MESSLENIIYVNLGLKKNRKNLKSGPPDTYFFLKVFAPPPKKQKKMSYPERFQRFFRWWILGILGQSYF